MLWPTLCDPRDCSTSGFNIPHHLPEFAQVHVHWIGDSIQPSHPLSPASPPTLSLSQHQGHCQWVSSLHQVAKMQIHQVSISPSNEYSGLISFKIDWFDLLAVQGTLKSFCHHHSSKASILQCSAFFVVQLSQSYVAAGKAIALNIQTFVSKVMTLLFNILSRFVIAFLPSSKHINKYMNSV